MSDSVEINDNFLGYSEGKDDLAVRIEANKRFSNFSLEDWLNEHLPFKGGNVILDVGCGNGNLFSIYSRKISPGGVIVGVDKSKELLFEAVKRKDCIPNLLLNWDLNDRFSFVEKSFDYVISTFAIYYANDVRSVTEEMKRVLRPLGEIFLIGPTDNNAKELYEFNRRVFDLDRDRDEKLIRRTNRLEKEFYPVFNDILGNASVDIIPSKLVFPDKKEFIRYYTSTLLFEESIQKTGIKPNSCELFLAELPTLEVSKEMIVLRGRKNE